MHGLRTIIRMNEQAARKELEKKLLAKAKFLREEAGWSERKCEDWVRDELFAAMGEW